MGNRNMLGTILGLIVAVVIVWGGYSSWRSYQPDTSGPRQAVFLADGQVYFAYASSIRNGVVKLKEIYYLRAKENIQPSDKTTTPASQDVDLIRLGDELHGPTDEMLINRDRINFIETMKDDSKINQSIKDFKEKKK